MEKAQSFRNKLQKISGIIQKNKYMSSISNGLAAVMPVLIGGAIFSLIDSLNLQVYQDFLVSTGLKTLTSLPAQVTTNVISIYVVFSIAYVLAESFKKNGFAAGIIAIMSFLIVTPMGKMEDQTMGISVQWLGAPGLFVAMLVAILVARVYVLVLDKEFYIKMPKGVPPTIEKSFAAIVPSIVIILIMLAIRGIFASTAYTSIHQFIFTIVQTPLTALGGSWPAFLICVAATSIFFFLGVHGPLVVYSVMGAIWTPLQIENMTAFQNGMDLPNHIVPSASLMIYAGIGGTGATIGLAFAMLRAKAARYKTLGRLTVVPSLFGINEPLIFGMPMVLNTKLLLPFVGVPLLGAVLSIIATSVGILPPLRGIAPMGTPVVVSGFIDGGWKVALFQVLLIILSYVIYYPFFKKIDNQEYKQETATAENAEVTA
ncbi:PTS system cellobiose-specific IIC component [Fontibacillus solani]|uniref:Permease IIC component n=1 Tax=Fontibacillus solani TaxID=1572857 RepID=A0A7W3SXC4_9BACL|nr:PTS transporter subunit EIIC [Fontibacillus solani]MBA9087937.1 PTS system cellobiose-specific IIC component [Fontibacillus solani]